MTNKSHLFIGTYTDGDSEGIYVYSLDHTTGELHPTSVTTGIKNPSFIEIHPSQELLYAVSELSDGGGLISAYAIEPSTGSLNYINQQSTGDEGPCHLSISSSGDVVAVANYSGGSITTIPINSDGSLGSPTGFIKHHGSSINPDRQSGPHPHSANIDPFNKNLLVPDLGLDKIIVYPINTKMGTLTEIPTSRAGSTQGAGPRHLAFHTNYKWVYVINELDSTITAFNYDPDLGSLEEFQNITTLPNTYGGDNYCADIHVSPNGKFLYGSNRGNDSIAIYAISQDSGKLEYIEHISTNGHYPRNFTIDTGGLIFIAANQLTNNIVSYWSSPSNGTLKPTGHSANVPAPVCLKLIRANN